MLLLLLAGASLLGAVYPDDNLAIGRPSLVSSFATTLSSCSSGSHLEVDFGSFNATDDCGCVVTNGTIPANTLDWYAVQFSAAALVNGVRITGITTPFDVLVGYEFVANMSLNEFSFCARYNTSNNAQNVSCTSPLRGSVVVLRALNDTSPLHICEVEVFGISGNLLRGSPDVAWQLKSPAASSQEIPWRMVDGDVSTCVEFPEMVLSYMTPKVRLPDGVPSSFRVLFYHGNVPLSAMSGDFCRDSRVTVFIITDSTATSSGGIPCNFISASIASSVAEFECNCYQSCQGDLAISLTSSSFQPQWRICEVIVIASAAKSLPVFDECALPMGPVGVSADYYDDRLWTASSVANCTPIRHARLNLLPPFAAPALATYLGGAWCPATAVASWIALDLGFTFKLRAVIVQGSGTAGPATFNASYVTSFSVSSALGQAPWTPYAQNGTTVLFSGPSHHTTPVLRSFSPEIVASRVRLDVLQWVKYPCVRMELIGCPVVRREWTTTPIPSMAGASGVPDSSIRVSSSFYDGNYLIRAKENIRLWSATTCAYYGAWSPLTNGVEWAEIRLDSARTIHGIAWRSIDNYTQYVINYNLQYKLDDNSNSLVPYSATTLATRITDSVNAVYLNFIPAFDAQTVRVIPASVINTDYMTWKSIRMEIYTAPILPTLISQKADYSCPTGYKSLSGYGCYRYVNQTLNYTAALQFCATDGTHLARITDNDEWNAMKRWIPRQSSNASCTWIGGQNTSSNESFLLPETGQVMSLSDVAMPVGTFNASASSALCLPQSTYALSSTAVSELHQFICEKDQPTPPTPAGLWPLNAFNEYRDLSPYRQHLSASSGVTSKGHMFDFDKGMYVFPEGAKFDNTANAHVDVTMNSTIDLSRELTLMFNVIPNTAGPMVYFRDPGGLIVYFGVKLIGTTLTVDFMRQRDHTLFTCTSAITMNGVYITVAVTYEAAEGKGRLYVGGKLSSTAIVGAGEQLQVSTLLRMGSSATSVYSPTTFTGFLRCVHLYDRVLRLHEIDTAMKRCGLSTLQGLLGFWPLHADLTNYVNRQHVASAASTQFTTGPSFSNNAPVNALQTDGTSNTAVTITGPLNVNGPYTLIFHTKMWASTGTLLSLLNVATPALTVTTAGSNVLVVINGATVGIGSCFTSGQWTQVVLQVNVIASTLSVFCNSSQVINTTLTGGQLSAAQVFTNMQLSSSVPATLSCLILLERVLTPLEIASYSFYCPFRPNTTLATRSTPRRHCGEWLAAGFKRSDLYVIDPDGSDGPVEPFTVFCNMSDSNDVAKAATVVRNMISRTLVNGNSAALSIPFPISYEANMTQIKALMSVSAHCRQWLQYECNASAIFSGATQMTGWYSRTNDLQPGWSGVPTAAAGCACSIRGQCAGGPTAKCNCDKRDTVWRQDGGWIEDMDLLPVSQLAFGDATLQNGYFTLGNLTCYG